MARDDWGDDEISEADKSSTVGDVIEKSLAATFYQTSRHLCASTGLSIGTVVDWLDLNSDEASGTVRREQVGNFWVYYLAENNPKQLEKPQKLFFGGFDGRQICLRDDPQRGNTGDRQVGQQVVLDLPKPLFEAKTPPLAFQNLPRLNYREVERLAAGGADSDEIADELDVNRNRFKQELAINENLRAVVTRGQRTFMENQKIIEKTDEKIIEPETAGDGGETTPSGSANGTLSRVELKNLLTPAFFENAGSIGKSTARIALDLGLSKGDGKRIDGILYDKSRPELVAAWKRGKAMFAPNSTARPVAAKRESTKTDFIIPEKKPAAKPAIELPEGDAFDETITSEITSEITIEVTADEQPFEQTLELDSGADRRRKLDEVQNKLMPPTAPIYSDVEFIGRLMPRRARGLQIGFEGDFFSLNEKQRMLMCEMANLNDEFQKENQ